MVAKKNRSGRCEKIALKYKLMAANFRERVSDLFTRNAYLSAGQCLKQHMKIHFLQVPAGDA